MSDNTDQPTSRKPLGSRWSWAPVRAEALWDAWAFAAMEAELALDAWLKAAHSLKEATFAAYREALDREERAATELAARLTPSRTPA
jgi:protein-disulfide isomerase